MAEHGNNDETIQRVDDSMGSFVPQKEREDVQGGMAPLPWRRATSISMEVVVEAVPCQCKVSAASRL